MTTILIRMTWILGLLTVLVSCEENGAQVEKVGVVDNSINKSAKNVKTVGAATQAPGTPEIWSTLESGQYTLSIASGRVSLSAREASRTAILTRLSAKIGFQLETTGKIDRTVTIKQAETGLPQLLDNILGDVTYDVSYRSQPRENGFRVESLSVGLMQTPMATTQQTGDSVMTPTLELSLPKVDEEIYLGSAADEVELVQQLKFGSIEDRVNAVSELMMDPAGLRAAYQVYSRDTSPEVRIAVLELISDENNFLAKLMIANSLQALHNNEVIYALSIVESLGDFSLAPQVEALYAHHDARVRTYSKKVRKSLTAGYFDLYKN